MRKVPTRFTVDVEYVLSQRSRAVKKTVLCVSAEAMIPELETLACGANQRGGLGDLFGHMLEGFVKTGIRVLPVTYFHPYNWQTGQAVNYHNTPARFLFDLDVDIYWQKRTVPIFTIDRAGARVYGINDPEAGIVYPDTWKKVRQAAFLGRAVHALLKKIGEKPEIAWCQEWMTMPVIPNLKDDPYFEKTKYLFTLHTLMQGALITIPHDWFGSLAINEGYRSALARNGVLDPTLGGVRLADLVTGVSEEHGGEVRKTFPEYAGKVKGIMNGTSDILVSPRIKALSHVNPYSLWTAHLGDKTELHEEICKMTRVSLDMEKPDIGLFRREVDYKNRRPMFEPNIHAICAPRGKLLPDGRKGLGANVIFGGVAHENDASGQRAMKIYHSWMEEINQWHAIDPAWGQFVYLPFYNAEWRTQVIRGCDIHVECPMPRCEACGTSWMVAQKNGILNVATLGGGHKGHSKLADPQSGTGDTLFIEPYTPPTLFQQLSVSCGWFYDWTIDLNDWWPRLKMNNFLRGDEVDVTRMIENYDEECFEPLLAAA